MKEDIGKVFVVLKKLIGDGFEYEDISDWDENLYYSNN